MRYRPGASRPRPLAVHVSLGAFALVALLAPFASPAQIVREKVAVEAVTVTVTARDNAGRPVRDLRAANLALSVDGKPVAIDTFVAEAQATAAAYNAVAPTDKDTGGEPILVPRKAASRLAQIEDRSTFALTFLDPAAGDHRHHRIEIRCRRPGVQIEYRRGYRIATEEERTLDRVVARFLQRPRDGDPLSLSASLSAAVSENGSSVTRVLLRYSPPRESAQTEERAVELLAVGEDAQGNRAEPIRWSATASRLDSAGTFEAKLDLGVPAGSFTWSLGVRDQPTGLVSYILSPSRP